MSEQVKSKRNRLTPEERVTQLMEIALELFAQKGLGRVGHGDIAKAAHVSTATVFNYFPTTESLNAAVMDVVAWETLSIFAEDVAPAQSPVLEYGARLLMIVEEKPNLLKIFLNWSHAFDASYRATFLALKDEILSHITQSLPERDGVDIDAQIIFGTGVLFAQMKIEGASEDDLNRFATRVAHLLA